MKNRLLVVGHLNLDQVRTQELEEEEIPGGGALYTSFAAALYGDPVDLLSTRCPDLPQSILDALARAGVNTDNVLPILGKQRRSSMAYDIDLVRTNFAHKSPLWLQATVEQVPRHLPLPKCSYSCIYLAPLLAYNQLLYAQWAHEKGIPVAMDLSEYYALENTEAVKNCLGLIDIFMPSEVELDEIFPELAGDLPAIIEKVRGYGVSLLVIKRSTAGSLICCFNEERCYKVGIRPLPHVADATGAGDSFNGAFLSCYLATKDTVLSARYASAVASCCIQQISYLGLLRETREYLLRLAETVPVEIVR